MRRGRKRHQVVIEKLLKEEKIRFKEEKFALESQALVIEDTHIIFYKRSSGKVLP